MSWKQAFLCFQVCSALESMGSCYNSTSHVVSCNVAESACNASGIFWYAPGYASARSGCCHCRASCVNTSSDCNYYDDTTTTTTLASMGSCYNSTSHVVSCNVAETSCNASGIFWYAPGYASPRSGCCHCRASCANTSDDCTYYDTTVTTTAVIAWGCYDVSTHRCACDTTEAACQGTWTSGCRSCLSDTSTTAGDASWGCYDMSTHTCACDTTEAACQGSWTASCRSCNQGSDDASSSGKALEWPPVLLPIVLAWVGHVVAANSC